MNKIDWRAVALVAMAVLIIVIFVNAMHFNFVVGPERMAAIAASEEQMYTVTSAKVVEVSTRLALDEKVQSFLEEFAKLLVKGGPTYMSQAERRRLVQLTSELRSRGMPQAALEEVMDTSFQAVCRFYTCY